MKKSIFILTLIAINFASCSSSSNPPAEITDSNPVSTDTIIPMHSDSTFVTAIDSTVSEIPSDRAKY